MEQGKSCWDEESASGYTVVANAQSRTVQSWNVLVNSNTSTICPAIS